MVQHVEQMQNKHSSVAPTPQTGTGISLAELIRLREEALRLDLAPRGKVLATRSGGHLSRFRGRGMEFDESRVYIPGDDPRNMDWRVTARTGKAHVKCYREERERPVWLMVDLGQTMRFGTRTAFKSVIAARAAALIAWAATEKGDRIGGFIFDETRHFECRPAPRTRGLLPLLNALSQQPLPGKDGGHADFAQGAKYLVRLVRPGSLVFMLSDFRGAGAHDATWFTRLAAHSEVVLIDIVDPIEMAPPPAGRYPVTDGERRAWLDTRDQARRSAYRQRFARHTRYLAGLARRHRAHLLRLRTDEPVGTTLVRGLQARLNHGGHNGAVE